MERFKQHSDPVFKGCTRPPLVMGVPLAPFVGFSVPLIVISVWALIYAPIISLFSFLVIVFAYFWMRLVTKTDDQRLLQLILRFQLIVKQKNRWYWGTVSYSPYRIKKTLKY